MRSVSNDLASQPPLKTAPPVCRFRLLFLRPTFRFSILASLLLQGLIMLDGAPDQAALLVARLLVVVGCALYMGLLLLVYRVRVTPAGLTCPDWPLVVRELPWQNMHTACYYNLLGFRFLVIYPEGSAVGVWLPLFLRHLDQFSRVVEACVAPEHPLRASLAQHGK